MAITKYVCGFLFDLRRTRVLLQHYEDKLDGLGGKVESDRGELPGAAMTREGVRLTNITLPTSSTPTEGWYRFATLDAPHAVGNDPAWRIYYYCHFSDGNLLNAAEAGMQKLAIYPSADLPANILPNLTWLIPMAAWDRRKTYRVEEL